VRDLVGDWRALRLRPGLIGRASVSLRGVPDTPLVTRSPVGGQRAAKVDQLRWEAPSYRRPGERWAYSVQVVDAPGRVLFAAEADDTSVTLPRDLAWSRGQCYVWTVAAVGDDGQRADGMSEFCIVAQDVEARVDVVEDAVARAHRQLPGAGPLAEDVLLALVLDQTELRNDADRQWRSLASARPAFAAWSAVGR
jgi:hypothetical protein